MLAPKDISEGDERLKAALALKFMVSVIGLSQKTFAMKFAFNLFFEETLIIFTQKKIKKSEIFL